MAARRVVSRAGAHGAARAFNGASDGPRVRVGSAVIVARLVARMSRRVADGGVPGHGATAERAAAFDALTTNVVVRMANRQIAEAFCGWANKAEAALSFWRLEAKAASHRSIRLTWTRSTRG